MQRINRARSDGLAWQTYKERTKAARAQTLKQLFWSYVVVLLSFNLTNKGSTHFVNQLHDHQLENVTKSVNLVNTRAEVIQSSVLKHSNDVMNLDIRSSGTQLKKYKEKDNMLQT